MRESQKRDLQVNFNLAGGKLMEKLSDIFYDEGNCHSRMIVAFKDAAAQ